MPYAHMRGEPLDSDSFWAGYFAATIAQALNVDPLEGARQMLGAALKDYKRSPACSPEEARLLTPKGE